MKVLLCFVVLLSACASWRVQQASPEQVLATPRSEVRLTLADGTVHTIHAARIVRHAKQYDDVVGFRPRESRSDPLVTVRFPITDIRQIEAQEVDVPPSLGVVLLSIVVVGAIALTVDPPFSDLDLGGMK